MKLDLLERYTLVLTGVILKYLQPQEAGGDNSVPAYRKRLDTISAQSGISTVASKLGLDENEFKQGFAVNLRRVSDIIDGKKKDTEGDYRIAQLRLLAWI